MASSTLIKPFYELGYVRPGLRLGGVNGPVETLIFQHREKTLCDPAMLISTFREDPFQEGPLSEIFAAAKSQGQRISVFKSVCFIPSCSDVSDFQPSALRRSMSSLFLGVPSGIEVSQTTLPVKPTASLMI